MQKTNRKKITDCDEADIACWGHPVHMYQTLEYDGDNVGKACDNHGHQGGVYYFVGAVYSCSPHPKMKGGWQIKGLEDLAGEEGKTLILQREAQSHLQCEDTEQSNTHWPR